MPKNRISLKSRFLPNPRMSYVAFAKSLIETKLADSPAVSTKLFNIFKVNFSSPLTVTRAWLISRLTSEYLENKISSAMKDKKTTSK